jgi:hypothetical protein
MIIQIAGTSGSGKSHLMRSFMKWAEEEGIPKEVNYIADSVAEKGKRGSPIGYKFGTKPKPFAHNVFVVGAYESPTGGCDTIKSISQVFAVVEGHHKQGVHVLFEGLFCMNQTRGPALAAELGKKLVVLQLTTPLATCIASINSRRADRGEGELANKKNTTDNYNRCTNYCNQMRNAGARVIRVSRDEALDKILELLEASP